MKNAGDVVGHTYETAPVAREQPQNVSFPKDRPQQDGFVIQLLICCGLVSFSCVFNDGITLRPIETRNRNIAVWLTSGPAYNVKLPTDELSRLAIKKEARILEWLAAHGSVSVVSQIAHVSAYDEVTGALITDLIEGRGLGQDSILLSKLPIATVEGLGLLLRETHASSFDAASKPSAWPFAIGLLEPSLSFLHDASSATLHLTKLVQKSAALQHSLERIAKEWRFDAFIHGDLKFDNLLLQPAGEPLALLDWEHARRGDARWDIGSFVGELIYVWVIESVERDVGALAEEHHFRLSELQRLVNAFIGSYDNDKTSGFHLLLSSGDFVVARIIQSVFEGHRFRSEIDLAGVRALQAANNIAEDRSRFYRFLIAPP